MNGDPYEKLGERFSASYSTLRGAIRDDQTYLQLKPWINDKRLRIIDVGGGEGRQTVRHASDGHEVVLLDPSADMLARARKHVESQPREVQDRVTLVEGYASDAEALLGHTRFDVVLCHGVIMYQPEPESLLADLCGLLRPGGLLSVIAKSARALAVRPALQGNWSIALKAFDVDRDIGGLGVTTRGDDPEQLSSFLKTRGFHTINWYGIRVLTDHLGEQTQSEDYPEVLAVELRAAEREPYRQFGRLFHLVAKQSLAAPASSAQSIEGLIYVDDQYRDARGGWSSLLSLSCSSCKDHLSLYQKDGPGPLLRCYKNRLITVKQGAVVEGSVEADREWLCPKCGSHLGTGFSYEDGRWAFALDDGAIEIRVIQSEDSLESAAD